MEFLNWLWIPSVQDLPPASFIRHFCKQLILGGWGRCGGIEDTKSINHKEENLIDATILPWRKPSVHRKRYIKANKRQLTYWKVKCAAYISNGNISLIQNIEKTPINQLKNKRKKEKNKKPEQTGISQNGNKYGQQIYEEMLIFIGDQKNKKITQR